MSFINLHTAAQILQVTPEELGHLFACGLLKAEASCHGGYVVRTEDVMALKGERDGGGK